ncbi:MAG TPA: fibronectin type III-like domain-contianing protein, partial [Acidimicrobiales bacterium]
LLGFERVELDPGESRTVSITADPRLIASFDGDIQQWRIDEGSYTVAVGPSAVDFEHVVKIELTGRTFGQ